VDLGDRVAPASVGLFWHRDRLLTPAAQECGEIARTVCAEIAETLAVHGEPRMRVAA
jgi:hypothetical protein